MLSLYNFTEIRPYWNYFRMDGVIMFKILKISCICVCVFALISICGLIADKQILSDNLIRFHVVGNSNSVKDQQDKLCVRDAIIAYLRDEMQDIENIQDAEEYLTSQLTKLEDLANETLQQLGSELKARVTLLREEFGKREYDTFSLPSGVYKSLRIEIGEAEGKNWWCVVFPSLCIPTDTVGFEDTAVSAGMDKTLTDTLSGSGKYEIRFFFLDCLGKLENLFHFK